MELKRKIFAKMVIAIIMFIACVATAKATSNYDLGFTVYSYDYDIYGDSYIDWLNDFRDGNITADKVLADDEQINPGDYIVVGSKVIYNADASTANMTGFTAYYRINLDLFEVLIGEDDDEIEQNVFVDNRLEKNGGTFPSKWDEMDSLVADDGIVTISVSSPTKKVTYYANQKDQPMAFVFLKLKDNAPAGENINFSYFTDETNSIYTIWQNSDDDDLEFNLYNIEDMSVFGQAAHETTLTNIEVAYTVESNPYTSILEPSFVSSTYEYATTVPSVVQNVTIKLPVSDPNTLITSPNGTPRAVTGGYELDVTDLMATVSENTINNIEFSLIETVEGEEASRITIYTLHITRIDNNTDFTLSLSEIDNDDITYDEDTKTYTATTTLDSTVVTATTTNREANVTGGTGSWSLTDGENTRSITVQGADCREKHSSVPGSVCTTNTYTLKVTKLSTDARLQTLVVTSTNASGTPTSGELSPTFNIDNAVDQVYTYTYPEGTTKISVVGTVAASGRARITSGTGEFDITDGTNSTTIVVTAEDGTTTRPYTINFVRRLSNDGSLQSLTVTSSNGTHTLTPGFSSIQKSYTLRVPHTIDKVTIDAEATSPNAKGIGGLGEVILDTFEPITKNIVVTAENDDQTTYTITITREKSNNAFLTDIRVNGTSLADFNKENGPYTIADVRGDIESLEITYDKEEPHAEVSVTGTTLQDGMNTITLTVTAQNGTAQKAYTISVRRLSNNADLQNLRITSNPQGTLTPEFSGSTTSYNYKYDRNVTNIAVSATAFSGVAVEGTGSFNPSTTNSVTLKSISEDRTEKEYTITFTQEIETDSTISSLEVKNGDDNYTPVLKPGTNTYTVVVPGNIETVDLIATPTGSYVQNVNGEGKVQKTVTLNLNAALTTETFDVIAENGSKTTYTVEITRNLNTEAFLESMIIDGEAVEDFSSTNFIYNLEVPNSKTQISIAETHSLGATVTGYDGVQSLDTIGVNVIKIKVVSEDGKSENTYTINIKRKSRDASITSLTATSTPVSVVEKTGDLTFRVDVPYEASSVTLIPTVATGARVLNEDELVAINPATNHIVTIRVEAEDGNVSTYEVTLNVLPSSNAFLESLSISPGALKEDFNRDLTSYTATVETNIDKTVVSATAEGEALIEGDGEHDLQYGENTIVVKVTAPDDTVKNYTITITRMKKSDKSLSNLKINGETIVGFEKDKTSYTIDVPYNTSSINIEAIPTDSDAHVSGDGPISIAGNSTTVTFTVTAHDSTTRDYTVIINKSLNDETRPTNIYLANHLVAWNEAEGYYEVTLGSEMPSVGPDNLEATLPDGANFVSKGTELVLETGKTDFDYKFTVKAQDNHQNEYTIKVHRELSAVKTLDNLTSSVGTLNPPFNENTGSYNLTLPLGTTSFTITANKTSARSTVIGVGDYTVPVTNNKVIVTVTSEDNNSKTYEINIIMEEDLYVLDTLSVEGYTLSPVFNGKTLEYSIGKVANNVDKLTVNATVSNSDLRIKYIDGNNGISTNNVLNIPAAIGENNIKVRVENSAGDVLKTYTINYNKVGLEQIISSVHTLDDDYVLTAKPDVSVDTFITQFDNEPTQLFVYESDGKTRVTGKPVGTGMIIKLERDGVVLDQLQIVIEGDTNGDGKITVNDAVIIVNHTLGTQITGAFAKAADVNNDAKITVNDAVMIVNHTLGTSIY